MQTRKIMNSTALPSRYFGTQRQCFAAARLTWLGYGAGRKRKNGSVWKDRIIVASTCRRSVQFGCYITWLSMANCVSVMIKMLPLFNFTISPWARGGNFTYRYHLWWQRLLMIFRIAHLSAIYFDMIALSGWQLKIVMSSFIHTPNETGSVWWTTLSLQEIFRKRQCMLYS